MPIVRIDNRLHYFAHVPKCGGTSIEKYMEEKFGRAAFLSYSWTNLRKRDQGTICIPQHMPYAALFNLIPEIWLDSSFAVVRHPFDRFISAFHMRSLARPDMLPGMSPERWFNEALLRMKYDQFSLDNHLGLQSTIVPTAARVFKYEHGLDAVKQYIDSLTSSSSRVVSLGHQKMAAKRNPVRDVRRTRLPKRFIIQLKEYYAEDFERFGYEVHKEEYFAYMTERNKFSVSRTWLGQRKWIIEHFARVSLLRAGFRFALPSKPSAP